MNNKENIDNIPIDSTTKTIQNCFRTCLYRVPQFQRPYSWENEQLLEFWNDVVKANGDFFFGSTVTWVSEERELFNDTHSIIDGQQRLTTSTIILSAIRDMFKRIATEETENDIINTSENQALRTQGYIVIADDDENEYPVLERPENMFYETIQKPGSIPSGVNWNGSARRIGEARKFFEDKILNETQGMSPEEKIDFLKTVRGNVLKARLIQVELKSEEDGFLIFETLNTRGADLKLSDLVKNLLVRGGADNKKDRDAIATRWESLSESVQRGSLVNDVLDRFIWQSWNSRRDAVKEPELFKKISNFVGNNAQDHLNLLKELEEDSDTYEKFDQENRRVEENRQSVRNAFAVPEFVDSISALAMFNISVANSALMAMARKYQSTKLLTKKQLIEASSAIENFHFLNNALAQSSSTGGTRGRYNRFAVLIESASTKAEVSQAISELKEKLRHSTPEATVVKNAFQSLFYAPKLNVRKAQKPRSRKIFITYVLMKIASVSLSITPNQDLNRWSIEHIKPQRLAEGDYNDPIYSIGNLCLLNEALNSKIGDGDFNVKSGHIVEGSPYLDPQLREWVESNIQSISEEQILDRSKSLAELAIERVWTI